MTGAPPIAILPVGANPPAQMHGRSSARASNINQSSVAGSAISRKIKKVLAIRTNSASCREAMTKVSDFFDENTVHARRNLRADVDAQSYKLHEKFVDDFSHVERTIESLDTLVSELETALQIASEQLKESKSKTKGVLQVGTQLRTQRSTAKEKQQILVHFLEKFQIPELQLQIVKSTDYPINDEFFDAVAQIEEIRRNAHTMLDLMSHQGAPTAGVDILHETSEVLETAFERLYVWVQKECRTAQNSSTWLKESKATFLKSLELLRERPVYFNYCITDVGRVRRQLLVQAFHVALSQGDPANGVRPIEAHAYDPLRYCGDMLAWIHEHAVKEKDILAPCLVGTGLTPRRISTIDDNLRLRSLESIMDFVLEGLVHPFKVRVEGVLRARNGQSSAIISFYRTSQLFSHFAQSLSNILESTTTVAARRNSGSSNNSGLDRARSQGLETKDGTTSTTQSQFVQLLRDLHQRTFQTFLDMCDTQAQKLRERGHTIGLIDLGTPAFVTETVKMLEEVLDVYDGSLTTETPEERIDNFLPILSAAYDPLLNHCQQVSAPLDENDRTVFLVNCISAMHAPLTKYEFTGDRLTMYVSLLEDLVNKLITSQSRTALDELGLNPQLLEDVRKHETKAVDPVRLTDVLKAFYTSLFTLKTLALPQLDRIVSHNYRSEVRRGVSREIAHFYTELYNLLQVDNVLKALATHTPDQVKVLLE